MAPKYKNVSGLKARSFILFFFLTHFSAAAALFLNIIWGLKPEFMNSYMVYSWFWKGYVAVISQLFMVFMVLGFIKYICNYLYIFFYKIN